MKKNNALWAAVALIAIGITCVATGRAPTHDVVCRLELDREVLPAGSPQTAILKITLEPPAPPTKTDRPRVNLAIVLDRSGSMTGQKIAKAKQAAIEALRRLGPDDIFSLVVYDDTVETIVPAQPAGNTEWIEGRIRQIRSGNSTALFAGVSQGAAEIRKHLEGDYVHRIILLSDGIANRGPSTPADLGRLGTALLKEHISVTTVGVGTDYNEDLMTRLAQKSDGNTYFVENSADLPRIFAAELGDVLTVVARKVVIELDCAEGARPVRIIGRDGRIRADGVEIYLNQLYGGQEKYVLVEVEVPGGSANETRHIAVARCSYENAITRRPATATAKVTARFSASREEVDRSANADVQTEYFYNVMAITKDKAVELWDSGQKDEAIIELRAKGAELKQIAVKYNLPEEAAAAPAELEQEAQALESEGMSRSRRKSIRTDSYQIRMQQQSK